MKKVFLGFILLGYYLTGCNTTLQNVTQKITTPLGGLYAGSKRVLPANYSVYVDIKDNKTVYVDSYCYIKGATFCHVRDTLIASDIGIFKSDLHTLKYNSNSLELVNNVKMYPTLSGFITFNLQSTTNRERLNELREKCIGKTFKRQ